MAVEKFIGYERDHVFFISAVFNGKYSAVMQLLCASEKSVQHCILLIHLVERKSLDP